MTCLILSRASRSDKSQRRSRQSTVRRTSQSTVRRTSQSTVRRTSQRLLPIRSRFIKKTKTGGRCLPEERHAANGALAGRGCARRRDLQQHVDAARSRHEPTARPLPDQRGHHAAHRVFRAALQRSHLRAPAHVRLCARACERACERACSSLALVPLVPATRTSCARPTPSCTETWV